MSDETNGHDSAANSPAWDAMAKGLLKAELARRNITYGQLVVLLHQVGVRTTKASIDNKISRGTFSAAFLLQCLRAIGCSHIRIDEAD